MGCTARVCWVVVGSDVGLQSGFVSVSGRVVGAGMGVVGTGVGTCVGSTVGSRVGAAIDFACFAYGVWVFSRYSRVILVGRTLPPAGFRPRLGLGTGVGGALATRDTIELRTLKTSSASVGEPVGAGGFGRSRVWASIIAGRVRGLVVLTTLVTMDRRILEITSVSVGVPVGAVSVGISRVWVRIGIVGAGVGANE